MKKPVALVILDGTGESPKGPGNAVTLAKLPNLKKWMKEYPNILMNASGLDVGLPKGQMGNSEVGHLNIGAGRVVYQSLSLMNKDILEEDGNIKTNKFLLKSIKNAKKNKSKINILGLLSDGGVHSSIEHIISISKIIKSEGAELSLHLFSDGRDVAQKSFKKYIDILKKENLVENISSISGRFFAMDRDKRWERIQKSLDVIVERKGIEISNIDDYIKNEYANKRTDEFFEPGYIKDKDPINDKDSIIFINFRPDRAREMSHVLVGSNTKVTGYDYEPSTPRKKKLYFVSAREYAGIKQDILYPPERMKNLIGEVLQKNGLKQMRAAETEKYPHVTFFMDGGEEVSKSKEIRILVDSPKVSTYDLEPEMSCELLTNKIIDNAEGTDAFLINFAQPDMVGHTGVIPAVVKSLEIADKMLLKLYEKIVVEMDGVMIITADHGNADRMINKDGSICTTHTTAPVRLIITDKDVEFKDKFTKKDVVAKLGDVAPTILKLLDVKQPKEMTGESLIK